MSLSALRVTVAVFPGSNCDRDMMVAIEKLAGRRPALVWHKQSSLDATDLVIIPGGFSYGDYLRCGALAARSPIMMEGALVLPLIKVGMMEASATRRPSMPCTFNSLLTTAIGSLPILQVPTGW